MNPAKHIAVIAGPSGSGKDAVINEILARCPNTTRMVTATTRAMRPGEREGIDYHFLSNDVFKKEIDNGNILEHYYRADTNTYYGSYKPDIDARVRSGKTVLCQLQIVGAKYFKAHYGAATIFIMPDSEEALEKRIRGRSDMSDTEWEERKKFTKRELEEEAPWYDYRVVNYEGMLDKTVDQIIAILQKEGYTLA